jgi:hypothetical protein
MARMSWNERLRKMDSRSLDQLEQNAREMYADGNELQRARSEMALEAIAKERRRRGLIARAAARPGEARPAEAALFERVKAAFTARPPNPTETALLQAVAAAPQSDAPAIIARLGVRQGYPVNARLGEMCHVRETWLGQAPAATGGKPNYCRLLVDDTPHKDGHGHTRHAWTLKAEALAALKELHIVE